MTKAKNPKDKRTAKGQFAKGGVGNPAGPESKYRKEYAEQAYKLCLLGATNEQIAGFFNIAERTVKNWVHDYPEFGDAVRRGKAAADAEVAHSLYRRALGYSHPAVKIVADAKTGASAKVKYTEQYPPDTVACIFWLKNRARADWRDKIDHEHGGKMTLEQLVTASGQKPTETPQG